MTRILWLTERSERHQQMALDAAPENIEVEMCYPASDWHSNLHNFEILISERRAIISDDILAQAPDLKLIVRLGSLIHDIDLDACHRRGIMVSRQPVVQTMMVAEHLIMMMLNLLKKVSVTSANAVSRSSNRPSARTDENTFHYNWNRFSGIAGLHNQTIAIIGMGEIGVELARRLRPFHPAKVLFNRRTRFPAEVADELGITCASPEGCYRIADILVNLLPYSVETNLMLNAGVFNQMKRGSLLIHAGSGSTIDEQALADALRSGRIGGAALDTFEYEPLQEENPLVALASVPESNVILTPHIAAGTENLDRRQDYAEVERYLRGLPLLHVQNDFAV